MQNIFGKIWDAVQDVGEKVAEKVAENIKTSFENNSEDIEMIVISQADPAMQDSVYCYILEQTDGRRATGRATKPFVRGEKVLVKRVGESYIIYNKIADAPPENYVEEFPDNFLRATGELKALDDEMISQYDMLYLQAKINTNISNPTKNTFYAYDIELDNGETLTWSIDDVIGNPYKLTEAEVQQRLFENIDADKIVSMGWRQKSATVTGDVKLYAGFKKGCSTAATRAIIDDDDNSNTLTATFILDNQVQTSSDLTNKNISINWFKENPFVTKLSTAYDAFAGEGWEKVGTGSEYTYTDNLPKKAQFCDFKVVISIGTNKYSNIKRIATDEPTDLSINYENGKMTCDNGPAGAMYQWAKVDEWGNITILEAETIDNTYTLSPNEQQETARYKCGVKDGTGTYIGSVEYNHKGAAKEETLDDYYLELENSTQTFVYSADGVLQSSPSPLTAKLYAPDRTQISEDDISFKWEIIGSALTKKQELSNRFVFSVANTYNINQALSEIKVTVTYQDKVIAAKTNFSFVRTGQPGSNGSKYVGHILINGVGGEFYQGSIEGKTKKLRVINTETQTAINVEVKEEDWTQVNVTDNGSYILKAKFEVDGQELYAFLPIIAQTTPKLEPDSGFYQVVYNSNGRAPVYPERLFRLQGEYDTVSWGVVGSNLKIEESTGGTCKVTANEVRAMNSIDYIKATVGGSTIEIPILCVINRYENAAINGWDGTDIAATDGVLLAPQGGFGKKETDGSFTGVVLGTEKTSGVEKSGLFGYAQGERTFIIDASTGDASFNGNLYAGKISKTFENEIQESNYNFKVDKADGILKSGWIRGESYNLVVNEGVLKSGLLSNGNYNLMVDSGEFKAGHNGTDYIFKIATEDLAGNAGATNKDIILKAGPQSAASSRKSNPYYNFNLTSNGGILINPQVLGTGGYQGYGLKIEDSGQISAGAYLQKAYGSADEQVDYRFKINFTSYSDAADIYNDIALILTNRQENELVPDVQALNQLVIEPSDGIQFSSVRGEGGNVYTTEKIRLTSSGLYYGTDKDSMIITSQEISGALKINCGYTQVITLKDLVDNLGSGSGSGMTPAEKDMLIRHDQKINGYTAGVEFPTHVPGLWDYVVTGYKTYDDLGQETGTVPSIIATLDTKLDKQLSSNTNGILVTDARGYIATSSKVTATTLDLALEGTTENIQGALTSLKNGKQDKLTAGSNITISNNTISATDTTYGVQIGGGLGLNTNNEFYVKTDFVGTSPKDYKVDADSSGNLFVTVPWVDTTYSASTGITIDTDNKISVDTGAINTMVDNQLKWNGEYYEIIVDNALSAGTCTGNANSATVAAKLSTNAGGVNKPVYFSNGVPVGCNHTLAKDVPSDAKFTDTTYGAVAGGDGGLGLNTNNEFYVKTEFQETAGVKDYKVSKDSDGNLHVSVPWVDTTYTAGTWVTIDDDNQIHVDINTVASKDFVANNYYNKGQVDDELEEYAKTANVYDKVYIDRILTGYAYVNASGDDSTPIYIDSSGDTAICTNVATKTELANKQNTLPWNDEIGYYNIDTNWAQGANEALKLTSSAGSANRPVYFDNGKPVACTHTLAVDVPSNAKFTDTTYSAGTGITIGTDNKISVTDNYVQGQIDDILSLDAGGYYNITVDKANSATTAASANSVPWTGVTGRPGEATTSKAGLMSAADKTKLNGLENYSLTKQKVINALGYTPPSADTNFYHTPSYSNGAKIATGVGVGDLYIPMSTDSRAGAMSAADKQKLDGIAAGANLYVLPTASTTTIGGVKSGSQITNVAGYTPCPIVNGIPYYQDTNTHYEANLSIETGNGVELKLTEDSSERARIKIAGSGRTSVSASGNTITISSTGDGDTYGRSENTTSKIFLMGTTTQSNSNKTSYSNVNCFAQNGYLYSGGNKVLTAHQSVSNSAPTLAWGQTSTIGTIGGTSLTVKMPANPDTNTTYTFATGDNNGQIKVTPSGGTAQNVSVKGLGSAAYQNSTAFAPASLSTNLANNYYTKTQTNAELAKKQNALPWNDEIGYYNIDTNWAQGANEALKLTSSAGSATQPVYFSNGKPVGCTYSLNATVPAGAKFTDTTYSAGNWVTIDNDNQIHVDGSAFAKASLEDTVGTLSGEVSDASTSAAAALSKAESALEVANSAKTLAGNVSADLDDISNQLSDRVTTSYLTTNYYNKSEVNALLANGSIEPDYQEIEIQDYKWLFITNFAVGGKTYPFCLGVVQSSMPMVPSVLRDDRFLSLSLAEISYNGNDYDVYDFMTAIAIISLTT